MNSISWPPVDFIYEMTSLARSDVYENIMTVAKAAYKSTDGSFGRSTVSRKREITQNTFSSKNNVLHLPDGNCLTLQLSTQWL